MPRSFLFHPKKRGPEVPTTSQAFILPRISAMAAGILTGFKHVSNTHSKSLVQRRALRSRVSGLRKFSYTGYVFLFSERPVGVSPRARFLSPGVTVRYRRRFLS